MSPLISSESMRSADSLNAILAEHVDHMFVDRYFVDFAGVPAFLTVRFEMDEFGVCTVKRLGVMNFEEDVVVMAGLANRCLERVMGVVASQIPGGLPQDLVEAPPGYVVEFTPF